MKKNNNYELPSVNSARRRSKNEIQIQRELFVIPEECLTNKAKLAEFTKNILTYYIRNLRYCQLIKMTIFLFIIPLSTDTK